MTTSNHKILVALIILACPSWAFGYVDPGSGYLLTQLVMGLGAGIGFFILRAIKRALSLFKSRR